VSTLQLLAHPQALLTASSGDGCVCLWGFNHASVAMDQPIANATGAGASLPPTPPQLFKMHAARLPLDVLPAQPPRCHTMLGMLTNGSEDRAALVSTCAYYKSDLLRLFL